MAGHMGSQDDKRHSGSQVEASELWFSWGEWDCGIDIPEGWQDMRVLWVLLLVPLMEGTTSLGSFPLGGTLTLGAEAVVETQLRSHCLEATLI